MTVGPSLRSFRPQQTKMKLVRRLSTSKQLGRHAPTNTDSFNDFFAIRFEHFQIISTLTDITTPLPTLALWYRVPDDSGEYA
jgi:hypothetical protein